MHPLWPFPIQTATERSSLPLLESSVRSMKSTSGLDVLNSHLVLRAVPHEEFGRSATETCLLHHRASHPSNRRSPCRTFWRRPRTTCRRTSRTAPCRILCRTGGPCLMPSHAIGPCHTLCRRHETACPRTRSCRSPCRRSFFAALPLRAAELAANEASALEAFTSLLAAFAHKLDVGTLAVRPVLAVPRLTLLAPDARSPRTPAPTLPIAGLDLHRSRPAGFAASFGDVFDMVLDPRQEHLNFPPPASHPNSPRIPRALSPTSSTVAWRTSPPPSSSPSALGCTVCAASSSGLPAPRYLGQPWLPCISRSATTQPRRP